MITDISNTPELGEIKININECDCCLTNDNLIICPLDSCEYIICQKCLEKIPGLLCPACRREIKTQIFKKRRRRIEITYCCSYPISRSTAEKILCMRYIICIVNFILIARFSWFLMFKDKPFFHDTWFLSTLGGIILLLISFFLLVAFISIISAFINCFVDCCCYLLCGIPETPDIIDRNLLCQVIENKLCCYFFGCIDYCMTREIHYITNENDTYIVDDYNSSDEDSLELD